jgi:U4/U6.U5 tri-snRNP-associated protein 1
MELSISLEETNKIRISLGLKPLVDDDAAVDEETNTAEDNYMEARERERQAKRARSVIHAELELTHADALFDLIAPYSELAAKIEK